jgi:hypothetical protein
LKTITQLVCVAAFSGLIASQGTVAADDGLSGFWLAPSSQNMQHTSGNDKLSVTTQWVSKLSDRSEHLLFKDEVISNYAETDLGSSLMAFATTYSESEKSAAMGMDLGKLSLYVNVGSGESYARNTSDYSGLDPYAYHGGNFSDFRYSGAALGLDVGRTGHLQFGQVAVEADRLETRRSSYIDYSNDHIYARYTHIARGDDTAGYGIDTGMRFGQLDVGYQELSTRTDVSTRRIRFNWNKSIRDRYWLDLSVHKNALVNEYADTAVMFSWQRTLGIRQLINYAADTGVETEGGTTEQGQKGQSGRGIGMGRGLMIGAGVAAAALVVSSGSDAQDNAERVVVNKDAQHTAARTVLNVFNPESVAINREYGGYIYQTAAGSYAWTEPIIGEAASVSIPAPIFAIPAGTTLRATYHTHAAFDPRFDNEIFSTIDLAGDRSLSIDGYLGTPAGVFKYFDVVADQVSTLGTINN